MGHLVDISSLFGSSYKQHDAVDKNTSINKSIIKFGTWNNKPIEWYVVKEEGFGILITTKNSIGETPFNDPSNPHPRESSSSYYGFHSSFASFAAVSRALSSSFNDSDNSKWSCSTIRAFLNNDFWNKAFNGSEKRKVINVYLNDVDSKDNVFLLSRDEGNSFLSGFDDNARKGWLTSLYNERLTRTPYNNEKIITLCSHYDHNSRYQIYESGKYVSSSYETYPSLYLRKDINIRKDIKRSRIEAEFEEGLDKF